MKYIVYKTTNTVNNKMYVGIHKTMNPDIFDGYYGCGVSSYNKTFYNNPKTPFQRAVKKYGFESFIRETLFVYNNLEEANKKENEIVNMDFVKRKDTYNVDIGGNCGNQFYPINQFDKSGKLVASWDNMGLAAEAIGISRTCINNAKLYKTCAGGYFWSENDSINVSDFTYYEGHTVYMYDISGNLIQEFESLTKASKFIQSGENVLHKAIQLNNTHKGYYWSFDKVEKFLPKETISLRGKTLYIYDMNGNFLTSLNGLGEAKKYYGVQTDTNIRNSVKCGKSYKNTQISLEKVSKMPVCQKAKNTSKKVGQYDLQGNLIKIFDSVKQAGKIYGSGVFRCCNNMNKSTKGFVFRYL